MKIIILGAGEVGTGLVEYLIDENNEITIVDNDVDRLRLLQNRYDLKVVNGHASFPGTLRNADASNADLIIAVTGSDETNMLACQLASSLFKTPKKIARIRNNDYLLEKDILFNKNSINIDNIISPEYLITEEISKLIEYPGTLNIADFCNDKISLTCVKAYYGGELVGYPVNHITKHISNVPVNIVAIYRNGKYIQVSNNSIIEADDEIFYVTLKGYTRYVMSVMQKLETPYRRIMIFGGTDIGVQLAHKLSKNYIVKLIETNESRALKLADEFDKTKVEVCFSDPSNTDFLQEEHIDHIDLFVAVSESDEKNIMSSVLTKKMGAKKNIVLIKKQIYKTIIEGDAIDIIISPQDATISALLTNIRHNGVESVKTLRRGEAEGLEVVLNGTKETSNIIGKNFSEITLPPYTTICAVSRDNVINIPNSEFEFEENDRIIFYISNKKYIKDLIKLFTPCANFFQKAYRSKQTNNEIE